ncbi:MAG: hypothetical protein Fur002_03970 [Anaerolineales bacterium]
MIRPMNDLQETPASTLCKACGLCCTGHLFLWARLNAFELNRAQALGLRVIRNDPRQRGFTLPCPLWNQSCTVYTSPDCPRVCHSYQCKLLKELLDEQVALSEALSVIQKAKKMIQQMEALLPPSANPSFRGRLTAEMERGNPQPQFAAQAGEVVAFYRERFGVNDLLEDEEDKNALI